MNKKRHTPEQIISKLREAEVLVSQGQSVPAACKTIEVSEQTYYRWRKEWGGLRLDQAKRFKELGRENGRLKKLVAEQALDNAITDSVYLSIAPLLQNPRQHRARGQQWPHPHSLHFP